MSKTKITKKLSILLLINNLTHLLAFKMNGMDLYCQKDVRQASNYNKILLHIIN